MANIRNLFFVTVLSIFWGAVCEADVLDQVVFGDSASEAAHGVSVTTAPVESGALGQSSRRISGSGAITFTLACDPVRQNYLTVKLWGGDTVSSTQYLYLYDPVNKIGNYQDDWPEVAIWGSQAPFPGRVVYYNNLGAF
jgi:hypothetical protein